MTLSPAGRLPLPFALGLLVSLAGCSREAPAPPAKAPETRPSVAKFLAGQDPNAENPDRDAYVDWATVPFRPELVGGRVVQPRRQIVPSLNAALQLSGDIQRLHKYLLGAPLLMESPDRGAHGFELLPHAAARMPEDAPDHLSQVWTLRGDLSWEDGRPVTSEDYAFTFAMIRDPAVESTLRGTYDAVESIEPLDAHRFRVRWKHACGRAIETIGLDFPLVPAHAMPHDAASFRKTTRHLACGPYRVAAFEPGSLIEVVLRDEYREKPFPIRPHYIERYVFEAGTRDATATLVRLINGDADIVGLNGDQYTNQATTTAFRAAAWRTHYYLGSYSFIAWNLRDPADPDRPHPVLGDVIVRRALSHMIPLDALAKKVFAGLARPISGPFDFRDPGYDPAISHFGYDAPGARALLDEAGWEMGSEGVRVKDGRPLRLTLATGARVLMPIAQALKEEARQAGVDIVIEEPAFSDLVEGLRNHRFDAGMLIWSLDAVEPDVANQWHSRYAREASDNYAGFSDPAVDHALDRIAVSFDPAERAKLRRVIHRRIHEEVPCTFLLANATAVGISKRLANVKIHDLGVRFHDLVMRDR